MEESFVIVYISKNSIKKKIKKTNEDENIFEKYTTIYCPSTIGKNFN